LRAIDTPDDQHIAYGMGAGGLAVDAMAVGCLGVERRGRRFFALSHFSTTLLACNPCVLVRPHVRQSVILPERCDMRKMLLSPENILLKNYGVHPKFITETENPFEIYHPRRTRERSFFRKEILCGTL
jgi:hypothetical protein